MKLFRFAFMVEERQVTKVLGFVSGIARDMQCVPVINAEVQGGKVRARTHGDPTDLLTDWMRNNKMQEITGPQAREAFAEIGLAPSSYSHYLARAVRMKKLKKLGNAKREGGSGMTVSRFGLVLLREDKP